MDSVYGTPVSISARTPRSTRRRAMSPTTPKKFSSPYQTMDLNDRSAKEMQEELRKQEELLQSYRESIKEMQEKMERGCLDESYIVETSNKISTHETRYFRRDISFLEEHVKKLEKEVVQLRMEVENLTKENEELKKGLQYEIEKRGENDDDSNKKTHELNTQIINLSCMLEEKDNKIVALASRLSDEKLEIEEKMRNFESQITGLKGKLKKAEMEMEKERVERKSHADEADKLRSQLEFAKQNASDLLEKARAYDENVNRNELRRSLEADNDEATKRVLDEVQKLSSQITCLTPVKAPRSPEELKMSVRVLHERTNDLKQDRERLGKENERLEKDLTRLRVTEAEIRDELDQLKRERREMEGNSEIRDRFRDAEFDQLKLQKADMRCKLMELQTEHRELLEKEKTFESTCKDLSKQLETVREESLKEEAELRTLIAQLMDNEREMSEKLFEAKDQLAGMDCTKRQNEDLKSEVARLRGRVSEMTAALKMLDGQYQKLNQQKEMAEKSRSRAIEQCNDMVVKIRNLESSLENQRKVEQELGVLKAENARQATKIEYLNEEIQETHQDYRDELCRLARENSESRVQAEQLKSDASGPKIDELKMLVSQRESELRGAKKRVEELAGDNSKLEEQLGDVRRKQSEAAEENAKLRRGLAEAVAKIEEYKNDCETAKEMSQQLAEQLGDAESKLSKLEEDLFEKTQQVEENEQVVSYLHSQINAKSSKVPKLGRRSTLLSAISEMTTTSTSSLDTTTMIRERNEIDELEAEKQKLRASLEEKKRKIEAIRESKTSSLASVASAPFTSTSTNPVANRPVTSVSTSGIGMKREDRGQKGVMRHDIPHKWKESRHLGLLTMKCAVCFVGISTFGKAKRCTHCDVQVHASCASRVYNTCGMPAQCATFYKENHVVAPTSAEEGRMNGWLRVYRDDVSTSTWVSSWAMMDLSKISFYNNDGADLEKPIIQIDLHREQWVFRAGMEMPLECDDQMRASNVLLIKMPRRNIYLLAPSQNSARRWSDCLQLAQRKKMMLTCKPSAFSDFLCLLVLQRPNNLTIHQSHNLDDWIIFAAQTGLYYTSMSSPRNPMRIAGLNAVVGMEIMREVNSMCLITGSARQLALLPIDSLKMAMNSPQPAVRPDVLTTYQHVSTLHYHQMGNQRFLVVADPTHLHVLKYNSSRDVFSTFAKMSIAEPVVSIRSAPHGILFSSDTFYYVPLDEGRVEARRLAPPRDGDYPIDVLPLSSEEMLLAYQNYGIFVDLKGNMTRDQPIEWEQMPMEFAYTAPYLYVIHYDSIEIMQIASYDGEDTKTVLADREVFECVNAHIIGKQQDDVFISVSSQEQTEVHRFNSNCARRQNNVSKRRRASPAQMEKRSKN